MENVQPPVYPPQIRLRSTQVTPQVGRGLEHREGHSWAILGPPRGILRAIQPRQPRLAAHSGA